MLKFLHLLGSVFLAGVLVGMVCVHIGKFGPVWVIVVIVLLFCVLIVPGVMGARPQRRPLKRMPANAVRRNATRVRYVRKGK